MSAAGAITKKQLDQLKADWLADPCWDIETTEGFEDFETELLAFRKEHEAAWAAAREAKKKADTERREAMYNKIGPAGVLKLIEDLSLALDDAKERIYRLENPHG